MQKIAATTSHIKVDTRFAGLLSEDFGISKPKILSALEGEPQKQAIEVCQWAACTDEPGKALLNWAKKQGKGGYTPRRRREWTADEVEASRAAIYAMMDSKAANYQGSSANVG